MRKLLLRLLERFEKNLKHKTGEKASISGVYRSFDEYIPISKGERMPPNKKYGVSWKLVVRLD